ncbi:MAG: alpha/beta hydrolase [Rhodospirillales bacterium]|nr:alpha/beta hydrolase [Rhodospirillales bacterium]
MIREEKWTIPTGDGHLIYGVTNYAYEDKPSDKCIVIVHGLTGHVNEYLHVRAAHYFPEKGYDVIRISLYPGEKGRRLVECTLQTHAADLNTVLKEKTKGYKKIFPVGHSYGGTTVMFAQPQQAAAICLWDPSFDLGQVWDDAIERDGMIILPYGCDIIAGRDMYEEAFRYGVDECLALSKSLDVPIRVIHAGHEEEAVYFKADKSYHSAGHPLNERKIVDGADHCFNNGDTCDTLLDYTYEWFERF